MSRIALLWGSVHGLIAVGCGAFGAHGIRPWLEHVEDGAQRLAWWETAAHYQLTHALALLAVAWVAKEHPRHATKVATWAFALGAAVFSTSLYAMTLTNLRVLGAITPFGGGGLMIGWSALAWVCLRSQPSPSPERRTRAAS